MYHPNFDNDSICTANFIQSFQVEPLAIFPLHQEPLSKLNSSTACVEKLMDIELMRGVIACLLKRDAY
jgi:hypothetical protein